MRSSSGYRHDSIRRAAPATGRAWPLSRASATRPRHRMTSRWYRAALLACGMALLSYLVARIGLAAVLASFRELSWRLVLVAFFPCTVFKLFDVLAWRYAFPTVPPPFSRLAKTLVAGPGVTPTPPTRTPRGGGLRGRMAAGPVSPGR